MRFSRCHVLAVPRLYLSHRLKGSAVPQIKFTDRKIASLPKPARGQVDYFDEGERGFGIRVGGVKTWFVKYVFGKKQRRISLGQYPAISLSEGRKLALGVKHQVATGTDPAVVRMADREALTFLDLAQTFIARHSKEKKRTWREDQRILMKYCRPWHPRKAADVTRVDVVDLLHRIKDAGAGVMANRVLACVRKAYNYGIKNGLVEANPAYMVDAPGDEAERDRVYSEDEIACLWRAFGECGLPGYVFKLCLATGQRLNEVMGMRWGEIDGDYWTLPGARTKNRRTHVVPLNKIALGMLNDLRHLDETWIFPSPRRTGQPLTSVGKAVITARKLSGVEDYRTHDGRRTFATELTKLGFSQFIAGRLLNHVQSGVTARYDRNEYLREKTEAVAGWGRWLQGIVESTGSVVQFVPPHRA